MKNIEVDGHVVALQLWDTAGQERYVQNARVCLLPWCWWYSTCVSWREKLCFQRFYSVFEEGCSITTALGYVQLSSLSFQILFNFALYVQFIGETQPYRLVSPYCFTADVRPYVTETIACKTAQYLLRFYLLCLCWPVCVERLACKLDRNCR